MDWWVWLIIVAVAGVFVFFEWRSRNKPLAQGLEDGPHGGVTGYNREGLNKPFSKRDDLDQPGG